MASDKVCVYACVYLVGRQQRKSWLMTAYNLPPKKCVTDMLMQDGPVDISQQNGPFPWLLTTHDRWCAWETGRDCHFIICQPYLFIGRTLLTGHIKQILLIPLVSTQPLLLCEAFQDVTKESESRDEALVKTELWGEKVTVWKGRWQKTTTMN